MRKLTENELKEILEKHQKYLNGEEGGECADFSNTDLSNTDLSYTNLEWANLKHANLECANLSYANLSYANLCGTLLTKANLSHTNFSEANLYDTDLVEANLTCAILKNANLSWANLAYANLQGANLCDASLKHVSLDLANLRHARLFNSHLSNVSVLGANFANADLYNAKLDNVEYSHTTAFINLACPEEGSFVGFKKVRCDSGDCIAKLLILDDSKRSSATTRKCRASKVKVLGFYDLEKNELPLSKAYSIRYHTFIYHKDKIIEVENFDENRWDECSTGIHFFLTFDEAKNYHF